ncbi:hypothetical protein ACFYNL_01100 [Streptomyces sp. NPDC007808]|uniref:hypothetical protein n=1 Tax=Streptomyces sp. NPDC007808 TaxID=3364779 RepID=UPI0036BCA515
MPFASGPSAGPLPEPHAGFRLGPTTAARDNHRFSTARRRLHPQGTGPVNTEGPDHHDQLIEEAPKDSHHWFRRLITAHRARTEESTR